MIRFIIFIYGVFSYLVGLGGLVFFILFLSGWEFIPFHINSRAGETTVYAFLINVGLMILFGLQHTVMARLTFKEKWTKIVSPAAERSTYVLLSGIMMLLFCMYWQPLYGIVWHVENSFGAILLTAGFVFGWFIVVLSSFLINHFELFGLQQVYCNLRNKPVPRPTFTDRFLYQFVRHPLQLGVLIGLWLTPTMSAAHFMLSILMTVYVFIGLYFEEKDLGNQLGRKYNDYKKRVPMIIPFIKF